MKTITKQEASQGFDTIADLAHAGETVLVTGGGNPRVPGPVSRFAPGRHGRRESIQSPPTRPLRGGPQHQPRSPRARTATPKNTRRFSARLLGGRTGTWPPVRLGTSAPTQSKTPSRTALNRRGHFDFTQISAQPSPDLSRYARNTSPRLSR